MWVIWISSVPASTRARKHFGFGRVVADGLDLGRDLLGRDDVGHPLAADEVLDDGHGLPVASKMDVAVDHLIWSILD